jgi:purine-binding chemotaxis protein CheW
MKQTIFKKSLEVKKVEESKTFLTFMLGDEKYAIDILLVQEIHHYENVASLKNVPPYIKGFMRLRDDAVLVFDLRLFYHLVEADYTDFTIVVILNIGQKRFGIVVDKTPDILFLQESQIKSASELCAKVPHGYVRGVGMVEGETLILLDIEKLFNSSDLGLIVSGENS